MKRKVRDIIKSQMTILEFMYSKNIAEGYFQLVCHSAYHLAHYGGSSHADRFGLYHPYSFAKMKAWVNQWENERITTNYETTCI